MMGSIKEIRKYVLDKIGVDLIGYDEMYITKFLIDVIKFHELVNEGFIEKLRWREWPGEKPKQEERVWIIYGDIKTVAYWDTDCDDGVFDVWVYEYDKEYIEDDFIDWEKETLYWRPIGDFPKKGNESE